MGGIGAAEGRPFKKVLTGELAGATSATQLPDIPCRMAKLKAQADNNGAVYLGVSGVTKSDGTTDTTSGYELDAGDETGWLLIDNLNRLYRICDNAGDDLLYVVLR
ncbi:MAG: hypothetical protein WAP47_13130 [Candidatus Rokuibacteriota bacterium]